MIDTPRPYYIYNVTNNEVIAAGFGSELEAWGKVATYRDSIRSIYKVAKWSPDCIKKPEPISGPELKTIEVLKYLTWSKLRKYCADFGVPGQTRHAKTITKDSMMQNIISAGKYLEVA